MRTVKNNLGLLCMLLALFFIGCSIGMDLAKGADGEGAYTAKNGSAESYWQDKQTEPFYEGLDGSGSVANVASLTLIPAASRLQLYNPASASEGVRQNVPVSLRFSNSGANATIFMVFYGADGSVLGVDQPLSGGTPTTIAATAARDANGDYIALTYVFDSYGATHCALVCTAISAGTADAWVGSY